MAAARYDFVQADRYNLAWVQATRGCPHDCSFCVASSVFGRKVRYRPVDHVSRDIEIIKGLWNYPNGSFLAGNLITSRRYSLNLFRELRGLDIRYFIQTDISVGEDDELQQIDRQGFKHRYFRKYASLIQKIQSLGIGVFGAFIVGFDQETPESIARLGEFICINRLYASQITILTPYPGCRVRAALEAEDRLLDLDWSHYNCTEVTFVPRNFTPSELQGAYNRLHERVYAREELEKTARYFIERFKGR
ncbi:MAG: hypothetical protein JW820_20070 [Spirochaetales bacterium]|nr:hypothetical protein [Spirochaetales bacterium]